MRDPLPHSSSISSHTAVTVVTIFASIDFYQYHQRRRQASASKPPNPSQPRRDLYQTVAWAQVINIYHTSKWRRAGLDMPSEGLVAWHDECY